MKMWRGFYAVVVLAVLLSTPTNAQTSMEGTWTAHFLMPSGAITTATYDVQRMGDSLEAVMQASGRTVKLSGFHAEESQITFFMNPGFLIECRLRRESSETYKGSCLDPEGNVGPAVVAPPGVASEPTDIDLDEAFDVWGLSRELYEVERYPHLQSVEPDLSDPGPLPSRSVDLGGYHLNVAELGSGDVTVVLESGLGDDHQVWHSVQKGAAKHAQVVSYDRAGLGMSDSSPVSRSPDGMARELKELLTAAGFEPPYVLVGHATGSFVVRRFMTMYPDDVAGVVLVDPAHEEEGDRWSALDAASWEDYLSRKRTVFSMISEAALQELDAFVDVLHSDGFEPPKPKPAVPVIVLSGLRAAESPRWVGETPAGLTVKKELHRSLADELGGDLIVSAESGSHIHLEQPRLVVEAIEKIVRAIEK